MTNKNIEDLYPLSPMQHGMLFHSLYASDPGMYFEQFVCKIHDSHFDSELFKSIWQQIINRHTILRTAFMWKELDTPLQFVRRNVMIPLNEYDWREKTESTQVDNLISYLQNDRAQGFNLSNVPLLRISIIRITESTYYLIWSLHHILLDAWSISLLLKEMATLYENKKITLPQPIPYSNYIGWLHKQDKASAENFWRERLHGLEATTSLFLKQSVSQDDKHEMFMEYNIDLSSTILKDITLFTKKYHLTINTLIQAVWALLLRVQTNETDVIFGYVLSTRPSDLKNSDSMVGLFINTLPFRIKVPDEENIIEWMSKIQTQQVMQEQYSYCSLVDIQGWSKIPRGSPLFETLVIFENYPIEQLTAINNKLTISDIQFTQKMNYPLRLEAMPQGKLSLKIKYSSSHVNRKLVVSLANRYLQLLKEIVREPNRKIHEVSALTEGEREQVTVEWNNTSENFSYKCLHDLFNSQVQLNPDSTAVSFESQSLTYQELNIRANQLAHYLQRQGVGPEILIGLCVERSLEMIVGILGIMKAGGVFVPFDPNYPQERLLCMLEDSRAPIILTQKKFLSCLPKTHAKLICLDTEWETIKQESPRNPESEVHLENLAYVIYTSGSTGKPKGVMVSHKAIANRILWSCINYPITKTDRLIQVASLNFDISIWEIFAPLIVGARLVIVPPKNPIEIATLINVIIKNQVTILHLVPAILSIFLEHPEVQQCNSLKIIVTGGELLTKNIHKKFRNTLKGNLYHTYGPTECSISVTHWDCNNIGYSHGAPIGRPIANTQIYILNRNLQPVPIGVAGELHISGVCLARGYLNNPELTKEKFVSCPLGNQKDEYLYKTGDIARYLTDGNIEYLYRIDNQVKINGYRIELGELEKMLLEHPKIKESIVLVKEKQEGIKYLIAYVVLYPDVTILANMELENFLIQKLPRQMVPTVYTILESFPLTLNGKIDKEALLKIDTHVTPDTSNHNEPKDYIRHELTKIWEETLGTSPINSDDNFFNLGGHSLLAMRLMTLVEKKFKKNFSIDLLFQNPTIEAQTELLRKNKVITPVTSLVPIQTQGHRTPLFCIHPVGGYVFCYLTLAQQLGPQQPVYGLQSIGLNHAEEPHIRIEDMASYYIEAIREIQPQGPYQLLGWSFGGIVAYEMAIQLVDNGHEVNSLILIDSLISDTDFDQIIDDKTFLLSFMKDLWNSCGKTFNNPDITFKDRDYHDQINYICQQAKIDKLFPTEIESLYINSIATVFKHNVRGLMNYRPKAYTGDIIACNANKIGSDDVNKLEAIKTWTKLVNGTIETYEFPCDHYEILQIPNAVLLAEQLKNCLMESEKSTWN